MEEDRKRRRSRSDASPHGRMTRLAAIGVGLEALGMAVAAVAYAIHATALPEPAFAVGLAAFFGLTAAGLIMVARALDRGARWAVSAALTWQALQTLAGINLTGIRPALGVPVAILGVVVGVAVLVAGRPALRPSED